MTIEQLKKKWIEQAKEEAKQNLIGEDLEKCLAALEAWGRNTTMLYIQIKISHPRKVADRNRKLIYANEDTNDKCNIFIIPCTDQLWT